VNGIIILLLEKINKKYMETKYVKAQI